MPSITSTKRIPTDSLVLVTGVNGLIASHAADQLMAYGYKVRGTVRSASKNAYLKDLYNNRHGPDRFELVEVPDVSVKGAFDKALKGGVAAVAHVVGSVDLQVQDADKAAEEEIPWQIDFLESCIKAKTVKSFVFTSSAWAAWTPWSQRATTLDGNSWNMEAVKLARDEHLDPSEKGMAGFMAMKTLIEQGVWRWVAEKKGALPFTFNTLLLDTVIGTCLDPKNQGIPSTAGMVHWVWENEHVDILNMMQPQWMVDCRDAGRLYVALLCTKPVVDKQRIYAFGDRYSFYQIGEILKEMYPGHASKMARVENYGNDHTVVDTTVGKELLSRLGQDGEWRKLKESLADNAKSWLELEQPGVTDHKHSTIPN
ncbi:hypothetical protein QBC40DRAFT_65162 [Triangularia verruculosa]|uniref:NAD-dependent epimerase/dehydratase domain-containing protein n=1 Tax=Triangularia verruculosa TaxID=2587418 RepID=A0AAN7AWF9_9PEZI|nr:hypothetical protein QBC40DRAFT_65162 [Triangularia verruculosa]